MDIDESGLFDVVSLYARWIAHDMSSPLSAVSAGLDMGEEDLARQGTAQLVALARCLRLIAAPAQNDAQQVEAAENWFEPLEALARGRDVQLHIHLTSHLTSISFLSLASAGLVAALALPVIGATQAGGSVKISGRKNQLRFEAAGLSDKKAHHIKEILARQLELSDPADMPFYVARLAAQKIGAQISSKISDKKLSLQIDLPLQDD